MIKTTILFVLPLSIIFLDILASIIVFAYLEYRNLFRVVCFKWLNSFYVNKSKSILRGYWSSYIWFLILFYIFFFKILVIYDFNFKLLYFNNLIISQFFLFFIFYCVILSLIYKLNLLTDKYSFDLAIFLSFLFFISFTILTSNNVMTLFLNLEIMNVLIMYSFLISLQNGYYNNVNMQTRNTWLTELCMYQFILNFFSSILYFFVFNVLVSKTFSTNFLFLGNLNLVNHPTSYYFVLFYLAFLIKLGVGPWVLFKIELYRSFNWFLLILYTITYFSLVLVFFFNLFLVYYLPMNIMSTLFLLTILFVTSFTFSFFIFSHYNIFVFFSFSSLINIMLILIQFMFITLTLINNV